MEQTSSPRLFALLIGINTYNRHPQMSISPDLHNLQGAVADAENFYMYLTSDLGVPEEQITLLSEDKATRLEIIKAFQKLGDERNEIRKGDSIVVFYAGLGGQVLPPNRLSGIPGCPQYTELLLPYDYNEKADPAYQKHMGIPDYTLAALLATIAENKGDNITVIFDCCHSASALRERTSINKDKSTPITRGAQELNYRISDGLDEEIWGTRRAISATPQLRYLGTASYVFFSACTSFELANEKDGRGYFTAALLKLLQELGSHTLSCSQIISRLEKIDGQSPQCQGVHSDRPIFHGFLSSRVKRFFDVRALAIPGSLSGNPSTQSPKFILMAGSIHGFSEGDEFTVYKSRSHDDQNNSRGILIVDEIEPFQSTLKIPHGHPLFDLPCNPAPVLLTRPAKHIKLRFQLYIDPSLDGATRANLISLINQLNLPGAVSITSVRLNAHILLSIENDANLRLDVVDQDLIKRNLDCSHHLVDADIEQEELARIFKDLAHYYWHLKHSPSSFRLPVDIAFYKLKRENTSLKFCPINEAVNLYNSNTEVVMLDTDDLEELSSPSCYGLMVTNNTRWDLFPALFYFDNANFTISPRYQPPLSKQKTESPLKTGASMTIGYGVGAGGSIPPFTFSPSPERVTDQNMKIGFFKLILSVHPIDFRGIAQQVPIFDRTRATGRFIPRVGPLSTWTSFTIIVVRRLHGRTLTVSPSQKQTLH